LICYVIRYTVKKKEKEKEKKEKKSLHRREGRKNPSKHRIVCAKLFFKISQLSQI